MFFLGEMHLETAVECLHTAAYIAATAEQFRVNIWIITCDIKMEQSYKLLIVLFAFVHCQFALALCNRPLQTQQYFSKL